MNKKLPENLAREWEKTLLGLTVAALLAAALVMAVSHYADSDGTIVQSSAMPSQPDYIDFSNRTFMQLILPDELLNPLTFTKKMAPTARVTDPPKTNPTPPTTGTAKNDPPKTQPDPPPPKKADRIISIRYEGLYKGLQNNELAFVTATDSASRQTSQEARASGEILFDSVTIDRFDADALHVSNGDRQLTVPLSQEIKVKITE